MYRPSNLDKAYLAGLIDGEGSIIIRANCGNGNSRGLSLIVQVALASKPVLVWAKSLYKGQVYTYKDKRNEEWKPIHHWHVASREALRLLLDVEPFMRVKRMEANVAIEFQERKSSRGTGKLTDEESQLEHDQRRFIKVLKKGVVNV